MVTIKDIRERLEHYKRLELAGLEVPSVDAGPPVILWTTDREGNKVWEILPEFAANLAMADFAQSGALARAAIYRKPPAHAPFGVVRKWAAQFFKVDDETDH